MVGRFYAVIWLLWVLSITLVNGFSVESRYPSYAYVCNEFDVDIGYLHEDQFVSYVQRHEKALERFYERTLQRGEAILPTMQNQLLTDGVSDLFIYLAMIESGLQSSAISPKKAVGVWQFMATTARAYDLTVCQSYDERCDTESATAAAIAYLNKLHQQFGKWYLAAMAYNCGEGCVQRAIDKAGTTDLAVLTDHHSKYLPRETREYIQKLLLIAMIGESRSIDRGSQKKQQLIEVEVAGGTKLSKIADLLKIDVKRLRHLNPALKTDQLPLTHAHAKITIPLEKIYAFYLRYRSPEKKVVKKKKSHLLSHYVALGETLESVAQKYQSSREDIRMANHLKSDFLMLDTLLVIPVTQEVFEAIEGSLRTEE